MIPRRAAGLCRLAVAIAVLAGAPAAASPLTDGLDAYERGDYAVARDALQTAAAGESAAAKFFLGIMYAKGHGLARDPVTALMWLELSAQRGFAMARRSYDDLAATVTSDQRAEAAARARAWRPDGPGRDE